MSRPTKFDRVSKLVLWETGVIPLSINQLKDKTMVITFNSDEVSPEKLSEFEDILRFAIPYKTKLQLGEN